MTPTNDRDDDLRRALHDAVSDVQPRDALDQIRSRTDKVVTMNNSANRRWFLPTIAVAAVMAAVIGGAFWMTRDDDPSGGPAATPSQTPSASTPTQTAEPDLVARAVPVYFVGDTAHGPKLYREFQQEQICEGPECLLDASTTRALTGQPLDSDYRMPWPAGTGLNAASYNGDVLTLDLSGDLHDRPAGMSQELAEAAVEQLIYSAQAGLGEGRVPVQLLLDGDHTDTVLGVPASEPLAAGAEDDVLAPVWINTPAEGAEVASGFEVSGVAMSFEATVVWQLKQGETVVEEGFTTAEECCTRAPYSFTVDAAPGDYTLVVQDDDPSGGEGPGVSPDTKEITVQ